MSSSASATSMACLLYTSVPDMTYSMWYSDNIGIKFIIDDSLALGSVWETEIQLENGVAEIIAIYPTEAAMEIGPVSYTHLSVRS